MSLTLTEKQTLTGVYVLETNGFVDTSTSSLLEDVIRKFYESGKLKIVINFAGTEFVSSSGWGAIVGYLKRIRAGGGDIKLAAMIEKVDNVFKLMEFNNLIDSFPSVEEAVSSFDKK
jgi:anti-sigma B factor antagonist